MLPEQMGRSSPKPAMCLQNPCLHERFFPAWILFQRSHLGIENCNLSIEKKEVNMQSLYFKFSLISLLKVPFQSAENTKHRAERCTSRSFSEATISISLTLKQEYVSRCHLKSPVGGFWGENTDVSPISVPAPGLLGQGSFPVCGISPSVRQG